MPMEEESTETASELGAAIIKAHDELQQIKACSDFYKSLIPDYAEKKAHAQQRLDAALAARRAANPLKKRLEGAQAAEDRRNRKRKLEDSEDRKKITLRKIGRLAGSSGYWKPTERKAQAG